MVGPLISILILSSFVAKVASQRGYSGVLWFFISLMGAPLMCIVLLTILRNRTLSARRDSERRVLMDQMKSSRARSSASRTGVPDWTIGEEQTLTEAASNNTLSETLVAKRATIL